MDYTTIFLRIYRSDSISVMVGIYTVWYFARLKKGFQQNLPFKMKIN